MTLLEFITDLQSQGFTDKEVFDKAQEFKKNNATEEVVKETEVVEETVEEVEEGNSNDSPPTDADVDQTVVASEETEVTESTSEDGSLESEEQTESVVIPTFKAPEVIEDINDLDFKALYGDELMEVSVGDMERASLNMDALVNTDSGSKKIGEYSPRFFPSSRPTPT